MSRDTRLQRTIRRAIDRRLEKERDSKPKWRVIALRILIYVVGVPSLIVGGLQLLPRLSVVPQDSLDARNPFLAPFVISNDGYITLYGLQAICSPRYVQLVGIDGKGGQIILQTPGQDVDETGGFTNPNFVAAKLPPSNKMTFPCQMALPNDFPNNLKVGRADIAYLVTYHVFGISWKHRHINHFSLSRDSNGSYHWLEEPLS